MLSLTVEERTAPWPAVAVSKTTSGSTGQPLEVRFSEESRHWREATKWRGYGWGRDAPPTRARPCRRSTTGSVKATARATCAWPAACSARCFSGAGPAPHPASAKNADGVVPNVFLNMAENADWLA